MICRCKECGRYWSVSWMQIIPKDGYACPRCIKKVLVEQGKAKTNTDKEIRKYLIATGSIIRHSVNERNELKAERKKLNQMILNGESMGAIIEQSRIVDKLINDYYSRKGAV